MSYWDFLPLDLFMNKMTVDFDMFCLLKKYRIISNMSSRLIVTSQFSKQWGLEINNWCIHIAPRIACTIAQYFDSALECRPHFASSWHQGTFHKDTISCYWPLISFWACSSLHQKCIQSLNVHEYLRRDHTLELLSNNLRFFLKFSKQQ